MNNTKILYARQVSPEEQKSPLLSDEFFFPNDIVLTGNRRYRGHTTPAYENVVATLGSMAADWEEANFQYDRISNGNWKKVQKEKPDLSINELLRDYQIEREDGREWTEQDQNAWRKILEDEICDSEENILTALGLITQKQWESSTIRGCCQSDWQNIFYSVDAWNSKQLEAFEAEYFNTGSEWIVDESLKEEPNDPEDISGASIYCVSWGEDNIRKEIANAFGCSEADVVLFQFDGYTRIPKYKKVS